MRKRKKDKIIVGTEVLLLCMIVGILRINATSITPPSNQVSYNKNSQTNVQSSINDLYNKVAYGDAMSSDILSGKTALVGGKKVVGTYECPTLSSQTLGDAIPEDINEGKVAWVNGNRIVGKRTALANEVELGDYIRYIPSKTSYTIYAADTYSNLHQTINPSELDMWRVIRKNEDGTVELVSEYVSSKQIHLGPDTAYANWTVYKYFISTLNVIAEQYEDDRYTLGSRHMGYDKSQVKQVLSSGVEASDEGYLMDKKLVETAIGTLMAKKKGTTENVWYWLASRGYKSDGLYFGHVVRNDGSIFNYFTGSTGSIRPIVILKSTLKITGGDGTESSPYTLGV